MALFYIKAMTKYRFKTKQEFKDEDRWDDEYQTPIEWCQDGDMNKYMGRDVPDQFIKQIEAGHTFTDGDWTFEPEDCIINEEEIILPIEQILEQIKLNNSLITKEKTMKTTVNKSAKANPVEEKFVFMDKTVNILNVGFQTCKNVVLYGPGE